MRKKSTMRFRRIGLTLFTIATTAGVVYTIRWMWLHLPREAVLGGAFILGVLLMCLCVIVALAEEAVERAMRRWQGGVDAQVDLHSTPNRSQVDP
jgi:predicted outer membrane lipoprotein